MNKTETFRVPSDQGHVQYTVTVLVEKVAAVMRCDTDYPSILVDGVWIKIDSTELARAESLLSQRP